MSRKTRPHPRARTAVVHLPRRPRAARFVPSGRSIVVGLVLAALATLAYVGARETSVFAVRTIEVEGVSPSLAHRVEVALRPLESESLLKVSGDEISRLATALPNVAGISYDRAFPNALRVRVELEQPLAVLRHGAESWLVSRRGRVTAKLALGAHANLPRIWLPQSVGVSLGATLATGGGAEEVAALVPLRAAGLARRVATVRIENGQVAYVLRGGLELRVGAPDELPLKLAIAHDILARTPVYGYLDVSVPERPVARADSQVSS